MTAILSTSRLITTVLFAFTLSVAHGSPTVPSTLIVEVRDDSEKFRIATAYERTGDYRNAARLYQELHASQPSNSMYFDGVVRTLSALGQYASLLPLAEKQAKQTDSPSAALLVGTLYGRLTRNDQARSWWEQARALSGDDESILVQIGRDQMDLLLNADALETFIAARGKNGSPSAYADEIFKLRSASGDVTGAVADVFAAFRVDGDAIMAERRLSMLLSNENGSSIIAENLAQLPQDELKNLRLAVWFYRETKQWSDALDVVAKIDARSSLPGSELLMFAEGARASESYDVALKAYDAVARSAKDGNVLMSAVLGSVRCLELLLRSRTNPTIEEAGAIITRYDEIISRYGSNPVSADALYFSALLYDEVLKDVPAARDRLMRLRNSWKMTSRSIDASLKLADMFLVLGDDSRAREALTDVLNAPRGLVGDRVDIAQLKLADMALWDGRIDSAKVLYAPLTEASGSLAANDAIDRMLLLNLVLDDSASVKSIAQADGLIARRRYTDAISVLRQAVERVRDNDLRDRALLMCSRCYLSIGDTVNAGVMLKKIIDTSAESIYGDRAMWLYAEVTAAQKDTRQAIQVLETLLRNYPRSIIAPDARERIRRLRGDSK